MKKLTGLSLLAAISLVGCDTYEQSGAATGAVVGGLLGNQVGGGSGRVLATIAGATAGSIVGGNVGKSMDEVNRMKANQALSQYPDQASHWTDPKTNNTYTIEPGKAYTHEDKGQKKECKPYTMTVVVDGDLQEAKGKACKGNDGKWYVVSYDLQQ